MHVTKKIEVVGLNFMDTVIDGESVKSGGVYTPENFSKGDQYNFGSTCTLLKFEDPLMAGHLPRVFPYFAEVDLDISSTKQGGQKVVIVGIRVVKDAVSK